MATVTTPLTEVWLNMTATLSLQSGTQYLLQNVGSNLIHLSESADVPSTNAEGRYLIAGDNGIAFTQAADPLWARSSQLTSLLTSDLSNTGT